MGMPGHRDDSMGVLKPNEGGTEPMSVQQAETGGRTLSVAVTGSGGSGAVTVGLILLRAIARSGFFGLMTRSAGPQIRGGESAAMIRFGDQPIRCMDDRFDLLIGIDWLNVDRFMDEMPLDAHSLVIGNSAVGEVPSVLTSSGPGIQQFDFKALAASIEGGRPNMVALGILAGTAGLPQAAVAEGVRGVLEKKGEAVVNAALGCVALGYEQCDATPVSVPQPPKTAAARWNISGNEACGLGALRGGVRFVAAYPITPASEVLEWLAPQLERLGGSLLQAEDELASVNMIIGASFGGVPSLTATSGPGLSLMSEGLGLALASETPVVVVNVMRGGPSTGIPTKSEQADLNLAIYGLHGDAPHLVLAPLSIEDCVFTTQWAVGLAEHLQTVAIVLSDQALGQSRAVAGQPDDTPVAPKRRMEDAPDRDYLRYVDCEDGISPMAVPGVAGGMYTADGLEHNPKGTPSSAMADHRTQMDKRLRKIEGFDYGPAWAEIHGQGPLAIVTWGSASGAVREAVERLAIQGIDCRMVAMRLLAPLNKRQFEQVLSGAERILVVEQNHSGQLYRYLNACEALPPDGGSFARPGPLPLRPGEIVEAVLQHLERGGDR